MKPMWAKLGIIFLLIVQDFQNLATFLQLGIHYIIVSIEWTFNLKNGNLLSFQSNSISNQLFTMVRFLWMMDPFVRLDKQNTNSRFDFRVHCKKIKCVTGVCYCKYWKWLWHRFFSRKWQNIQIIIQKPFILNQTTQLIPKMLENH